MHELKTDMRLSLAVLGGDIQITHKTGMIDVNQLLKIGNKIRIQKGLPPMTMTRLKKNVGLNDFIAAIQKKIDKGGYQYFQSKGLDLMQVIGKGNKTTTIVFLPIALKISSLMDADFEAELYTLLIDNQLVMNRDEGGGAFKALNIAVDAYLPDREGKNNTGIYIHMAKTLRSKIFGDIGEKWIPKENGNIWNSVHATGDIQKQRGVYEDRLITLLQMGVVHDWEHLKELINKL